MSSTKKSSSYNILKLLFALLWCVVAMPTNALSKDKPFKLMYEYRPYFRYAGGGDFELYKNTTGLNAATWYIKNPYELTISKEIVEKWQIFAGYHNYLGQFRFPPGGYTNTPTLHLIETQAFTLGLSFNKQIETRLYLGAKLGASTIKEIRGFAWKPSNHWEVFTESIGPLYRYGANVGFWFSYGILKNYLSLGVNYNQYLAVEVSYSTIGVSLEVNLNQLKGSIFSRKPR